MQAALANKWAHDIARLISEHQPHRNFSLRSRIKHFAHGERLDENDLDQLELKVRQRLGLRHTMATRKAAKVRMLAPSVRKMDSRTTKPAPKVADPELLTREHQVWRQQVLRMAGHRCQAMVNGKRCTVCAPAMLYADHIVERRDGGPKYDVRNGMALCASHHTAKTIRERTARLAARPV